MKQKYGVIFYYGTSNIGDDIQTYAAKRFLPHVDYVIDREKMDSFVTKEHEKVRVIMNGWYLHKAENWPPTPFIEPKLLSMHFTDNLMIEGWNAKYPDALEGYGKSFFEKYGPVGCRDKHTIDMMNKLGVKNYFSSCLTTTLYLGIDKHINNIIYAVDVSDEVVSYIKEHTSSKVVVLTHEMTKEEQGKSFEERMENVEKLLTKYHNAKMVVTSRLHTALPCLALETPVLLIEHDDPLYRGRLETFYDFVNSISEEDLLNEKVEVNFDKPKKNPSKYKKYRKQLIKDCETFIKDTTKLPKVSDREYIEWLEKTKSFQKDSLINAIKREHENTKMLTLAYQRIERLETKLNSIYASRSYHLVQRFKAPFAKKERK